MPTYFEEENWKTRRVIVSHQMDTWKLPHVNSPLNVWGIPLKQHTFCTEVTNRTLWSIKCSRSAMFFKIHLCENKKKRSLVEILSVFSNVFVWATRRWKEPDTYTASTRFWMRDVTYQNLETYQNWKCLIENRISRHLTFKTYLRWSHKLTNPKLIFKNCKFKAYFDALVYDLLSFKAISPFSNVRTVWLYTLSQCIGEQNQLGSHIMIHWRSYALGFCRKLKLISC